MRKRAVNSDKAKVVYGRRFFTFFLAEVQAGFKSHPDILIELRF
jgi:hypothetical protein